MSTRPRLFDAPSEVQAALTALVGPIQSETPTTGGYTPSIASTVHTSTRSLFVKAAGGEEAQALRNAVTLAGVTQDLAPALLAHAEVGSWALAVWEVQPGTPLQSWTPQAVAALPDLCVRLRRDLTPPPLSGLTSFAAATRGLIGTWSTLAGQSFDSAPDCSHLSLPALPTGLSIQDLAFWEADWYTITSEPVSLIHADLRSDNIILDPQGSLQVVDWSHLTTAPGWVDLALLLPELHTSNLNAHSLLATCWPDAPLPAVCTVLAGFAGFWVNAAARPEVSTAPGLRTLQRQQGLSALDLLASFPL